jgi:hypothetical protein
MSWAVRFDTAFDPEFDELPAEVQDELLAHARLLEQFGPHLARPRADTLNGSRHANMKELRFDAAGGVWRVAFAFDPRRQPSCSWQETRRGSMKDVFTRPLSGKRTSVLTLAWPG